MAKKALENKFPIPLAFLKERMFSIGKDSLFTYKDRKVELLLYAAWFKNRMIGEDGAALFPIDSIYQFAKLLQPTSRTRPHGSYYDQCEAAIEQLMDLEVLDLVLRGGQDYIVFATKYSEHLQSVPSNDGKTLYRWLQVDHIVKCRSAYQLAVYEYAMKWQKAIQSSGKSVKLTELREWFGVAPEKKDGQVRRQIDAAMESVGPMLGISAKWKDVELEYVFYPTNRRQSEAKQLESKANKKAGADDASTLADSISESEALIETEWGESRHFDEFVRKEEKAIAEEEAFRRKLEKYKSKPMAPIREECQSPWSSSFLIDESGEDGTREPIIKKRR